MVDYPPEEVDEFAVMLGEHGIAPIFLLAPTSQDTRIETIARVARGYVYYVSLKGVTDSGSLNTDEVVGRLAEIRRHVKIPVGVGFGIRDAQSAQRIAKTADAVVIGSKIIETMEHAASRAPQGQENAAAIAAASDWLHTIRLALDTVKRDNASV